MNNPMMMLGLVSETCRGNGVALGHGFHGVAYGIELVGDLAHIFGQAAHHGNTASVISDRAKRI